MPASAIHQILFSTYTSSGSLDPFSFTDLATATSSLTDAASYTFTSRNLGTAPTGSNRRYVIAAIEWQRDSGTPVMSTVTINGNSASEVVSVTSAGGAYVYSGIWIAEVPSGTSGSVVVTLSGGGAAGCAIGLVRMLNPGSSTATATSTDSTHTSGALNLNLNVPSGGGAMGSAASVNASTWTWTGLATEQIDVDINLDDFVSSAMGTATGTPLTVTATNADTTPSEAIACAASWGP